MGGLKITIESGAEPRALMCDNIVVGWVSRHPDCGLPGCKRKYDVSYDAADPNHTTGARSRQDITRAVRLLAARGQLGEGSVCNG